MPDKSGETTALAAHLEHLGANDGLKGAILSIDAVATNATIATAIRNVGADYLLAINANQPTLCAEVEACFADAPAAELDRVTDIEERRVTVSCEADWLAGSRRFPDELRLPEAKTIIRVKNRTELKDRCRHETRYFMSSERLGAEQAASAVRGGHWLIENALHWTLDVVFNDDQSRLRKAMAHTTGPWFATSPSIWSEPSPTSDPSSADEKSPDGTPTISPQSSENSLVNLDSKPFAQRRAVPILTRPLGRRTLAAHLGPELMSSRAVGCFILPPRFAYKDTFQMWRLVTLVKSIAWVTSIHALDWNWNAI